MTASDVQKLARSYPRYIRWSDEDNCYIGSLFGKHPNCTDAPTPEKLLRNLNEVAEMEAEDELNREEYAQTSFRQRPNPFTTSKAGHYIKSLRRFHELTQNELAEILGTNRSTLSKWERGERNPSGAAAKLLHILKAHPELLYTP